jgi:hypothetical protein
MKSILAGLLMLGALFCSTPAKAWNCTNPLDARVPVPAGTAGTFGDGNGQLFLGTASEGVAGQLYECEPPGANPPAGTIITNTNQNSNSNSNKNKNTNLNNNVATATGGAGGSSSSSSTSTATGGSVSNSGNSSSSSTVKNSGNSSISNSGNSHQHQSQTQSATSSADGNGDNSNNETTNVPREVASAYAPTIYPTVPCFKGFSGGAQAGFGGVSFGGGKIDNNCAALEAARQAPNILARCKILTTNKYYKQAGVTMEDCLGPKPQPVVVVTPAPPVPAPAPIITVNVPAPVVTIIPEPAPVVVAPTPINPALKKKSFKRVSPPCGPAIQKPAVWQNDDVDRLPVQQNDSCEAGSQS